MTETTASSSGGADAGPDGADDRAEPTGVRGDEPTDVLATAKPAATGDANSAILDAAGSLPRPEPAVGTAPHAWLGGLADPASLLPTYAGVVVALVGFALIAVAWSKVAGLVDVWRQMPYVMSAGLPGLGLVMTGLVVVNISARRQDAAQRARQMATLTEALRELRRSLETR